jgi:hypothetical protein
MSLALRVCFLVVDLGFLAYWAITLAGVLPEAWLFKDYHDPILHAWNWSFLPLDLFISATGLTALQLHRRGRATWRSWAIMSLTLTSCSGLQAISFWVLRGDHDLAWWAPNLFLLVYPAFFLPRLLR